jgi:peptidoglycan/LPS O-acetylase OafA/YrhL
MVASADRAHNVSSLAYCAAYVGDFYGLLTHSTELSKPTAHLWSLAVEEQFYLFWPAVLLLVVRRRGARGLLRLIGLGMVAAVVIRFGLLAIGKTVFSLPTTHADALLAGCGVAVLLQRGSLDRLIASRAIQWAGACVIAAALLLPVMLHELRGGVGYVAIEGFGVVLLLCALASSGPVQSLLATGPLVYCGRISYGVYVIHNVVIVAVARNLSHGDSGWAWAVFSIVVTFAAAAASRRWFESYFLRIKDRRFGHTAAPSPRAEPAAVPGTI